jgi:hypothetical protein
MTIPDTTCQGCGFHTDDLIQDNYTNLQLCPDCFYRDCDDPKDLELSVLNPARED